ncbi:unnamed protein product [Mytilus coruscus]|uniref:Uncharacterized protein n=1 Tax=Mytilus coruscus TaxID=42192 RepID=A0A6J8D958_MYTCO|nr:unnamed protein product [Mytilus coruscus]
MKICWNDNLSKVSNDIPTSHNLHKLSSKGLHALKVKILKMLCFYSLQQKIDKRLGSLFERHGKFIARHPWKTVILVCIIDIAFGIGILKLKPESGIHQYVPTDSTASKDKTIVTMPPDLIFLDLDEKFSFWPETINCPLLVVLLDKLSVTAKSLCTSVSLATGVQSTLSDSGTASCIAISLNQTNLGKNIRVHVLPRNCQSIQGQSIGMRNPSAKHFCLAFFPMMQTHLSMGFPNSEKSAALLTCSEIILSDKPFPDSNDPLKNLFSYVTLITCH